MDVQKHDSDTYLVSSRTDPDASYLVDLGTMECGCPGALEFAATSPDHPCAHIEAAMIFAHRPEPRKRTAFTFFMP